MQTRMKREKSLEVQTIRREKNGEEWQRMVKMKKEEKKKREEGRGRSERGKC